ncbi:basic proline-rich protein-like [Monodelphis domestica]|uniref:basic proline-rich protein-like n=1 Tax=Monodelphis domestica TaxID=13616 RepID=UPI0007B418DF|nr:basic proline-rich protein-like [Monodelphis domestica]
MTEPPPAAGGAGPPPRRRLTRPAGPEGAPRPPAREDTRPHRFQPARLPPSSLSPPVELGPRLSPPAAVGSGWRRRRRQRQHLPAARPGPPVRAGSRREEGRGTASPAPPRTRLIGPVHSPSATPPAPTSGTPTAQAPYLHICAQAADWPGWAGLLPRLWPLLRWRRLRLQKRRGASSQSSFPSRPDLGSREGGGRAMRGRGCPSSIKAPRRRKPNPQHGYSQPPRRPPDAGRSPRQRRPRLGRPLVGARHSAAPRPAPFRDPAPSHGSAATSGPSSASLLTSDTRPPLNPPLAPDAAQPPRHGPSSDPRQPTRGGHPARPKPRAGTARHASSSGHCPRGSVLA